MKFSSAVILLLLATLMLFVVPASSARVAHATPQATFYLSTSESDYDCNFGLLTTAPEFDVVSTPNYWCGQYTGSSGTLNSISMTLNYFNVGGDPSPVLAVYDDTTETLIGSASPVLSDGGSCVSPNAITLSLNVTPQTIANGDEIEVDLNYIGDVVIGTGTCDPVVASSITIGFNGGAAAQPTSNPCALGIYCDTAFAVFNVQHSGSPVGRAVVVLNGVNQTTQTFTSAASASTSELCTFSPSWAATYGAYWGCSAGETPQFILVVGVTYSYTVTLPGGATVTGSLTATSAQAWTVQIVPIAG